MPSRRTIPAGDAGGGAGHGRGGVGPWRRGPNRDRPANGRDPDRRRAAAPAARRGPAPQPALLPDVDERAKGQGGSSESKPDLDRPDLPNVVTQAGLAASPVGDQIGVSFAIRRRCPCRVVGRSFIFRRTGRGGRRVIVPGRIGRPAYAAAPCRAISARSAVREPGARGMRTRLHLKPGQRGTKLLLAQYGDRLVCVRYRYDAQRRKRFKTRGAHRRRARVGPARPAFRR